MAIVIEKRTNLDAPIKVDSLNGVMFTTEAEAHQFVVRCEQEGQELTLAGTITAKFVRADGNTVELIGSISDGAAVVTLAQDCYNVQGRFQLAIFNTVGDTKLCIYACVGYIQKAQAGNLIDSGGIIPDVEDLIADIQAAVESIPPSYTTLLASVAGTYSASKTYAVGDYAWYNGSLYRCSTAISTAEAWTSGHWTAAVLGDDVSSLKSAIDDTTTSLTDAVNTIDEVLPHTETSVSIKDSLTWVDGRFLSITENKIKSNSGLTYCVVGLVRKGEKFKFSALRGIGDARAITILDLSGISQDGTFTVLATFPDSTGYYGGDFVMPYNGYLVITANTPLPGVLVVEKYQNAYKELALQTEQEKIANDLSLINKYTIGTTQLDCTEMTASGLTFAKTAIGYSIKGTATALVNRTIVSIAQTSGVTYHYKLNTDFDNTTGNVYFYLTGVNGSGGWHREPELTWTATQDSTAYLKLYCPTDAEVNILINPILNANYTNAELYDLLQETNANVARIDTASVAGDMVLYTGDTVTWATPGTVVDYRSGNYGDNNPKAYIATEPIDITEFRNFVLTFEGYTAGVNGLVFYDANDRYVNGIFTSDGTSGIDPYKVKVQIPANAKYCRIGAYGTNAKTLRVSLSNKDLISQITKSIVVDNTVFNGYTKPGANVHSAFPMLPENFETHAQIAYDALTEIMKNGGYDIIPAYIVTDSHGNIISPFAWLNQIDKDIKCLHLGDIVTDKYNTYEFGVYHDWAVRINNIATVVGNHEVLHDTEIMDSYTLRKNLVTTDRHLGSADGYYYVDDHNFRVRYICLDPFAIDNSGESRVCVFSPDQIKWFAETLKESKYDVIIITHCPLCDSSNTQNRDGTETITISGPYPANRDKIGQVITAYQAKSSATIQVEDIAINVDFSAVSNRILCVLCGHAHAEGTAEQYGVRHYIAQNYQVASHWASTFIAVDRANNKITALKFDNTQNFDAWELSI